MKYAIRVGHHFSGIPVDYYYYDSWGKVKNIYLAKHFLTKFGARIWLKINYNRVEHCYAYNSLDIVPVFPLKKLSKEEYAKQMMEMSKEIDESIEKIKNRLDNIKA